MSPSATAPANQSAACEDVELLVAPRSGVTTGPVDAGAGVTAAISTALGAEKLPPDGSADSDPNGEVEGDGAGGTDELVGSGIGTELAAAMTVNVAQTTLPK